MPNAGLSSNVCLFHPDCNRWSRNFTGSALLRLRIAPLRPGSRTSSSLQMQPLVTASEDFHLALKQNSLANTIVRPL